MAARSRSRSRIPGMARLASGVVLGGVGLGSVISLAIDTEMKRPAVSAGLFSEGVDTAFPMPDETWPNAGIGLSAAPGSYRPDIDYGKVAGVNESPDNAIEPAPAIPLKRAPEAAGVEAVQEMSPPPTPQLAPQSNKSSLAQEGLY